MVTCYASVHLAFGRIALHFLVDVDPDPEVILSVLTQNGKVCSAVPLVAVFVCEFALGTEHYFYESSVAGRMHDECLGRRDHQMMISRVDELITQVMSSS